MTKQELGKRLRALREFRGLTQAEVATELETRGLTRTATGYGHYETGRSEPEIAVLTAICQILMCPLSALFASEDGQPGHPIDQIAALEAIDRALSRYKKEIA